MCFFFNEAKKGAFDLGGRRDEGAEVFEFRSAGDGVKKGGGVCAVLGLAGEVGDIGVEASGDFVVVSGAEVKVAFELAVLVSDDE